MPSTLPESRFESEKTVIPPPPKHESTAVAPNSVLLARPQQPFNTLYSGKEIGSDAGSGAAFNFDADDDDHRASIVLEEYAQEAAAPVVLEEILPDRHEEYDAMNTAAAPAAPATRQDLVAIKLLPLRALTSPPPTPMVAAAEAEGRTGAGVGTSGLRSMIRRDGDEDGGRTSTKCALLELPGELLIKIVIFAVCDYGEIECVPRTVGGFPSVAPRNVWMLHTVAKVCKTFHAIVNDPSAGHLILDLPAIKELQHAALQRPQMYSCARLLRLSPMLHTLRICDDWADDEVLPLILKNCPKLRHLDVSLCSDLTGEGVVLMLDNCPSPLESFCIEGCNNDFSDSHVAAIDTSKLQPLRLLNLSYCDNLGDPSIDVFTKSCPHIEELYLDGVRYITNHAVETIADAYASILRVLALDGADLADAALHSVSGCSRLERLALSFCDNFTDAGVAALAALGNMRSLKLRKGMHFSNDAVRSLFSSGAFDLLEELDLTECADIQDTTLFAIADHCVLMRQINLSWCWDVSNDGLAALVQNVPSLLLLNCTGIKRLTDTPFLSAAELMPDLRVFVAKSANNISDELLERLCEEMPSDLVAINYYGDKIGDDADAAWGSNSTGRFKVGRWILDY